MAYTFDVDLDPLGTLDKRISEATSQVDEDQQIEAAELRKVTGAAALELAKLAPAIERGQGGLKRTLSVVGHVGDGQAKLSVAVRVG